ncbi:unnamed protein product, partial [Ectocarpus fasciculatus]
KIRCRRFFLPCLGRALEHTLLQPGTSAREVKIEEVNAKRNNRQEAPFTCTKRSAGAPCINISGECGGKILTVPATSSCLRVTAQQRHGIYHDGLDREVGHAGSGAGGLRAWERRSRVLPFVHPCAFRPWSDGALPAVRKEVRRQQELGN